MKVNYGITTRGTILQPSELAVYKEFFKKKKKMLGK